MSRSDERDLSAAFEELTAPPSTAGYASRTPAVEIRTSSTRWPQALATALVVLVAVGGAGTFLALRTARQGGGPSSSAGAPPARSGAAMAYDSTSGATVMFGGAGGSGSALDDTWTWNGSAWTAAAQGPGSLVGVRMVDDPADGGVLLLGMPAMPAGSSTSSGGSGCVVGSGTGTATGGAATAGSPPRGATGVPGLATAGPAGPPLPSAVAIPPAVTCIPATTAPPAVTAPTEQTWLFSGAGWHRVASGSSATPPPAGAQLAFDSTSRQVVAVASGPVSCGPPLEGAVRSGASIACPVVGSSKAAGPALGAPCGVLLGCLTNGSISTWTWSRGSWTKLPAGDTLQSTGVTLVFNDPATQRATLMTQFGLGGIAQAWTCPPAASCPAPLALAPLVTTWTWTGSGWKQVSQLSIPEQAPAFAGATVATIRGHIVVLTTTGQTWTFAAGQWTQDSPASHPAARAGAAMSEGPAGTVVLFGGATGPGRAVTSAGEAAGSDTWTWDGAAWKHVAGTAPPPPATPSGCPLANAGAAYSCVGPTMVAPATAQGTPPQASPAQSPASPVP